MSSIVINDIFSTMNKYPFIIKITYTLLFIILSVYALINARSLLYPIFLAILIAYLLYPLAKRLERIHIPRILANILSIIIGLGVIFLFIYLLYNQLAVFAEDLPQFRAKAIQNITSIENFFLGIVNIESQENPGIIKNQLFVFLEASGYFIEKALSATAGSLAKMALLPVYVFFLLYYRTKFYDFLIKITPGEKHERLEMIIGEISNVTKKYMLGIVTVVIILCFLNSLGLFIVGIQYPILFGIISAMMNFIPYFGTLIGGAIPFIFALLTADSPKYALGVIILFVIIQFTENNILTPNIVGGKLNINPFFIILAILIGGMLWGLPGMIIAVPFLGMFKILCDNVISLSAYSFLLSTQGTEKHSITFNKIKNIFIRRKNR
jgi:predicted PurR-regulated permease PerM